MITWNNRNLFLLFGFIHHLTKALIYRQLKSMKKISHDFYFFLVQLQFCRTQSRIKRDTSHVTCMECCEEDLCNKETCGATTNTTTTTTARRNLYNNAVGSLLLLTCDDLISTKILYEFRNKTPFKRHPKHFVRKCSKTLCIFLESLQIFFSSDDSINFIT